MAKKPHKFAWNGVDIDTVLSASDLMSICTQVAAESNGSLFKTMHRLEESERGDGWINYVVKAAIIRAFQLMTFSVAVSAEGGRSSLTSTIGTYTTSQYKLLELIPIGPTEMVAHPTYMKFVHTVTNTVTQADPTAKVRIREGKRSLEPLPALAARQPAQADTATDVDPTPSFAVDVQVIAASSALISPAKPTTTHISEPTVTQIPEAPQAQAQALAPTAAPIAAQNVMPMPVPTLAPNQGLSTKPGSLPPVLQPSSVDDATTRVPHRTRPQAGWTLELPDGRVMPVEHPIIFGRDPIGDGYADAQLVAVPDSSRVVSKTHAVIQPFNGRITVTDLHSANGSVVLSETGTETECEPAMPLIVRAGASVELGGFAIKLCQNKVNTP